MYSLIYICLLLCLISAVHSCSSDEVTAKVTLGHGNTISDEHIYIIDATTQQFVQTFECYKCKTKYSYQSICLTSNREFRVKLTSSGNGWVSGSYFSLSINGDTILDQVRLDSGESKYYLFITPSATFEMITYLPSIIFYGCAIIAIIALVINRRKKHNRNLAHHSQTNQLTVIGYPNTNNIVSNYDGQVQVIANPYNPTVTSVNTNAYIPSATVATSMDTNTYMPSSTVSTSINPNKYILSATVATSTTSNEYIPSTTVHDSSVINVEPIPYVPYNQSMTSTKSVVYVPYNPSMNTGVSSAFATPQNPQSFI